MNPLEEIDTPLVDALCDRPDQARAGIEVFWLARRLERDRAELHEALQGVMGLVHLLTSRSDVPPELAQIAMTNHRMVTARAALAKLEE